MNNIAALLKHFKVLLYSNTARNIGTTYFGKIIEAGIAVAANIIIVRSLGPEKLGILMVIVSFIGIVGTLISCGLEISLVKFLADSIKHSLNQERDLLFLTSAIFVAASAFLLLPLYSFSNPLSQLIFNRQGLENDLKIGLIITAPGVLSILSHAVLRAYEAFSPLVLSNTVGRLTRLLLIVILASYATLDIHYVLIANGISSLIIVSIDLFIIANILKHAKPPTRPNPMGIRYLFRKLVSYTSWIYGSRIIDVTYQETNILILNFLKASSAAGYYSAALNLLRPFEFFPETIVHVMLPKVSGLKTKYELQRYAKMSVIAGLVMSSPLFFLVLYPAPILSFIFGDKFIDSANVVSILSINMILMIILNPITLLLHKLGKPRVFIISSIITFLCNIFFNTILVPHYGSVGSAYSNLLVYILSELLILTSIYLAIKDFSHQDQTISYCKTK